MGVPSAVVGVKCVTSRLRIGCSSLHACRRVPKEYKSGMINSWNKFCYTGGFIEAAVQLPGNAETSGFWVRFQLGGAVRHADGQLTSPTWRPATRCVVAGHPTVSAADQMLKICSPKRSS